MSHQDALTGAIQSLESLTDSHEEVGYPIQEKLNNALRELYELQSFFADNSEEELEITKVDMPDRFGPDGHDHNLYFEFAE